MAGSFLSHWPCSSAFFDPDSRLAIRVPSLLFEVSTIFYLLFSRIIDFHVPSASNLQLLTFNSSSFTQTLFHTTIFALRTTSFYHNQNSNPQFQVLPWHPYLLDNELKPLHHRVSALTLSLFLFACYSIPKIKHRSHPDPTAALCVIESMDFLSSETWRKAKDVRRMCYLSLQEKTSRYRKDTVNLGNGDQETDYIVCLEI